MKKWMGILLAFILLSGCARGGREAIAEESRAVTEVPETQTHEMEGTPPPERDAAVEPVFLAELLPEHVVQTVMGSSWHEDCPVGLEELFYLTVTYTNFDSTDEIGHLIVHQTLADEVVEIFQELYEAEFPIARIRLIDEYEADDAVSMEVNNTYGFCNRLILGTERYSNHSYGLAIDINPVQNPYIAGGIYRSEDEEDYTDRENIRPGMISPGDACYNAFAERGWFWGGYWAVPDYQHFEKVL